jgi:hypothetical protein
LRINGKIRLLGNQWEDKVVGGINEGDLREKDKRGGDHLEEDIIFYFGFENF